MNFQLRSNRMAITLLASVWGMGAMSGALMALPSDAQLSFNQGDYNAALTLLSEAEDVPSLLLRAEIISTQVMLGEAEDPHKAAGQARELAARALALEPDNIEAYIQHALAFGFETRTAGIFKAWRKKMPQRCKEAIDAAYTKAPDDARTSALMGAWHLGLVRKAGDRRAKTMFGASYNEGIMFYDAAIAKAPDDIIILGNYTIALLGIDAQRHREAAKVMMLHIDSLMAGNATEMAVQARMRSVLDIIDEPDLLSTQLEDLLRDAQ